MTTTYLPENYVPSQWDVLCGRGLKYLKHPGNERFRGVVQRNLRRYKTAATKLDKSIVVIDIINEVRSTTSYSSNETNFIRYDDECDRWFYINRAAAKKKVGQTIREMINQRDPEKSYVNKLKRRINYQVHKSSSLTSAPPDDPESSFDKLVSDETVDPLIVGEAPDCRMSRQSFSELSSCSLEEVENPDPVSCKQPDPKALNDVDCRKAPRKVSADSMNAELNWFYGSDIRVAAEHLSVELTSPFDWFSSCPSETLAQEEGDSSSSDSTEWIRCLDDTLSSEDCEDLSDSLGTLFEE